MKPNRFRQVVKEGRIPLGTMVWEFGTRGMPKILEAADLDFVLIDMEHSTFDGERVADLLACRSCACRSRCITSWRAPWTQARSA
ncbi:MAG: hypothetical protein DMG58_22460 [Acidobacteria bacterium]|nr:MAG: hypothetical protein DMG58_22460 [Acidobacteriota bacterium]